MRRLLFTSGFVLSLALAAGSFASIMGDSPTTGQIAAEQTFLIPKSTTAGIDECLADHAGCGRSAAASVCEAKGFSRVIAFGVAEPEDMTGGINEPIRKASAGKPKEMPFLVTCSR